MQYYFQGAGRFLQTGAGGNDLPPCRQQTAGSWRQVVLDGFVQRREVVKWDCRKHVMLYVVLHVPIQETDEPAARVSPAYHSKIRGVGSHPNVLRWDANRPAEPWRIEAGEIDDQNQIPAAGGNKERRKCQVSKQDDPSPRTLARSRFHGLPRLVWAGWVLVTRGPKLVEPAAGDWPTIRAFLAQKLDTSEVKTGESAKNQSPYFLGWLSDLSRKAAPGGDGCGYYACRGKEWSAGLAARRRYAPPDRAWQDDPLQPPQCRDRV